ncbi:MAG: hypothetical protein KA175_06330 [Flavobacteriales bacterium]|nr:hypothetical protein [Flavobacteriales bacterium]MBP6697216.1 hypothetical protein [Flavobacteriales bacterium]
MRILLFAPLLIATTTHALWNVPDANLRAWITANYPGAMVGNAVNENHPGVQAATVLYMDNSGIVNLNGVQAFTNVQTLVADYNPITMSGVYAPPNLLLLSLANCQLTGNLYMDDFAPSTLQALYVPGNQVSSVVWCNNCGLVSFNGDYNQITSVTGTQPPTLITVKLANNGLTGNAGGVQGLQVYYLDISNNSLSALPVVSFNVGGYLIAHHNQLSTLMPGEVPPNVQTLDVGHNQIHTVHLAGSGITQLTLSNNPLTNGIAELPAGLLNLELINTQLPCLPWLPQTLSILTCLGSSFTCLPNMPPSLDLSPGSYGFTPVLCTTGSSCYIPPPSVRLFAGLQGAWNETAGLMRDDLRAQGLLPLTEPYTAIGYTYLFNNTPLSVPASFFSTTGPTAIVDWVMVEVRQGGMPGTLVQSVPALLRRNGRVISTTGDTLLTLRVARGSYKVAVRHRNHLAVINFASQYFGNGPTTIDILNPGTTQLNMLAVVVTPSGKRLLPMGDVTGDKAVKYAGSSNDRDPILTAVGGTLPTAVLNAQYRREDVNLDGQVKYAGSANDRDLVLQVVGGTVPTATRSQVPVF